MTSRFDKKASGVPSEAVTSERGEQALEGRGAGSGNPASEVTNLSGLEERLAQFREALSLDATTAATIPVRTDRLRWLCDLAASADPTAHGPWCGQIDEDHTLILQWLADKLEPHGKELSDFGPTVDALDFLLAGAAPAEREGLTEHDANCLEWAAHAELERTIGKAEVREANAATFRSIAQKIRALAAHTPREQ